MLVALFFGATATQAQSLKVATFNTELSRKGPGILLRDIMRGEDPQIIAVLSLIQETDADILALQGFDYDLTGAALNAFVDALAMQGLDYPYSFAKSGNAGLATDLDLDGDGRFGGAGDAQGYGRFFGAGGMAILSRFPILTNEVTDFTPFLWRDVPDALLPTVNGLSYPSAQAQQVQRLSSHSHWVLPIQTPDMGRINLLTFHASPPVFDGPEDRNGKRNHDEVMFWHHYLAGTFTTPPTNRFVLLGDANLDPNKGDGRSVAIKRLLAHPQLQDPLPNLPTVNWTQTGPMRVDYVLPSTDWTVLEAGITPLTNTQASRHALVWVRLTQ